MKPILNTGLACKISLAGLALTAATSVGAEELGRLFFTPEQRVRLEYEQRQDGNSPGGAGSLTVNGIVQKHGGKRTAWINGIAQPAGRSDERAPESLFVAMPGQAQPVRIKVGQKTLVNPPVSGHPASPER